MTCFPVEEGGGGSHQRGPPKGGIQIGARRAPTFTYHLPSSSRRLVFTFISATYYSYRDPSPAAQDDSARGEESQQTAVSGQRIADSTVSLPHCPTISLAHQLTSPLAHYLTSSLSHQPTSPLSHQPTSPLPFSHSSRTGPRFFRTGLPGGFQHFLLFCLRWWR